MFAMHRQIGRVILASSLWVACQGDAAPEAQSASAQAQGAKATPATAATPAQKLVNAYIALQTELAKDSASGAKTAFSSLQEALKAKDIGLDPALAQKLSNAATQGAAAAKIADARVAFAQVSEAMLSYLASAKNPLPTALTVAHCPMALDNKGAKWLQLGETLANPYFGAEMLRCGTVERSVPSGQGL